MDRDVSVKVFRVRDLFNIHEICQERFDFYLERERREKVLRVGFDSNAGFEYFDCYPVHNFFLFQDDI